MASLYVIEQGAVVAKANGRFQIRLRGKLLAEVPTQQVDRITAFGNVHFTTPAVTFALREGIDVVFLSSRGTYRGRLQSPWTKDGDLRYLQYAAVSNPEKRLSVAKQIVAGKIQNAAALCARQERSPVGRSCAKELRLLAKRAGLVQDLAGLRGVEGVASSRYYQAFRSFLKYPHGFSGRKRRPPTDPVNALLSLGYTLLWSDMWAMVNAVGLDPYLGMLHEPRHGHAALVSDLIEEWRPTIVDALVLFLLNRAELTANDFRFLKNGKVQLVKAGLARFVTRYEQRLSRRVYHPRLCRHLTYRQCLETQARHLAAFVRGEVAIYQPFRTR